MKLDSYRVRAVHLTAIWAFGVGQPVLSLVDANPDLVVSQGMSRLDVVLLMLLILLVPPLVAIGYAWVAGRVSQWVGDVVYLFLLGLFLVPLALQLAKHLEPGLAVVLLLVSLASVGGIVLYVRVRAVRLFVGFSIVLPIIGLLWFVQGLPTFTGEAEAALVQVAHPRPVVFLVLDELPVSSLMTRDGRIDEVRFPAFARLARDGVWYRNATTIHPETSEAVPAILTGRVADGGGPPVASAHPQNVFTLLAGTYDLNVHEAATRLCPAAVCPIGDPSLSERLESLFSEIRSAYVTRVVPRSASQYVHLMDFDAVMERESTRSLDSFDLMLEELRVASERERSLVFAHLYLPHAPWHFLRSGKQYPFRAIDGWLTSDYWRGGAWPVLVGQQRHLLQVGYTDKELGRLLNVLDRRGLYDQALVVVVADHGASFVPGEPRRSVTRANIADIANIPMLVKYPGDGPQGVDDRGARTVDLVPTIADVLGVDLPWDVDGQSLLSDAAGRRDDVIVRGDGRVVVASLADIEKGRAATVQRQSAAFGEGRDSLFRIGTHKSLIGRRVDSGWARSSAARVRVDDRLLADVDTSSDVLPILVSGVVSEGVIGPDVELAVALNGRIVALTRPWPEGDVQRFEALVPESALRDGSNQVEVFAVARRGPGLVLTRL